jgi:uncharacterized protein (DUF1684 family)
MTTDVSQIQSWRDEQERSLRADDSWLTLAGLFWLNEGENTFGSGADQDHVFPAENCLPHAGTLIREGHKVTLRTAPGAKVTLNGQPVTEAVLMADGDGKNQPDIVRHDTLSFFVITRGHRVGIRLRDTNSPVRRNFAGRVWFDYNPAYIVEAAFTPYEAGKTIPILNILGDVMDTPSPGFVTFDLNGQTCTIDATAAGSGLFFNFRDKSCGKESYGAGRFLMAGAPVDGKVTIDFNKAVNPPCAFTIYATCPVAPLQNHLQIAIPAGEKYAGEQH